MKKLVFRSEVVISVVLSLFLVLCLGNVPMAQAADSITLTYQGKWEGHEKENWAAEQIKFKDYVAEATNGKIQIKLMPEVVKDNEVLDGVRTGVIDIGNQGLFSRRELALLNFQSLPMVPHKKVPAIMDKLMPFFDKKWAEMGVKQLGYVQFLPQIIATKKPANTFDSFKGMRLRVLGPNMVTLFKDAGALPLNMNNAEVYTSLQRGLLDGAQTALAGYLAGAWYESCKYLSMWPVGSVGMGMLMNMDSWNKLSPELQGQLLAAAKKMTAMQFEGVYKDVTDIEAKINEKGGKFDNPSDAEAAKLMAFVQPVLENWKKSAGADSEVVLKAINEVLGTTYK